MEWIGTAGLDESILNGAGRRTRYEQESEVVVVGGARRSYVRIGYAGVMEESEEVGHRRDFPPEKVLMESAWTDRSHVTGKLGRDGYTVMRQCSPNRK